MLTAVGVFFVFALLGMPLAFAIGVAAFLGIWMGEFRLQVLPERMMYAVDSFPLMAIPFFMLAGELLIRGGAINRIVAFANALVGRVPGGLGHVTVISAMGMAAVSGTAVATASALGSTLIPTLEKAYDERFGSSIVVASANLGPIIPPSAGMIVYAIMAGPTVSVSALFAAGILPGLLLAVALMGYVTFHAIRSGYPPTGEPINLGRIFREGRKGISIFLMPVVVVGGIIGGVFTATEGAAIAVVFALFYGLVVTRELKVWHLPYALLRAAITSAVVGALIAFASAVTFLFTIELIPQMLADFMRDFTESGWVFLALVMVILLVVGMFIEANAAFIMLVPLFAPLAMEYGLDPLHFGFLFVLNIVIGSATPPIGVLLFVVSGIRQMPVYSLIQGVWPFIILQFAVLGICMAFPQIVTFIPRVLGF